MRLFGAEEMPGGPNPIAGTTTVCNYNQINFTMVMAWFDGYQ